MAQLKGMNATNIEGAIQMACQIMRNVFDTEDDAHR